MERGLREVEISKGGTNGLRLQGFFLKKVCMIHAIDYWLGVWTQRQQYLKGQMSGKSVAFQEMFILSSVLGGNNPVGSSLCEDKLWVHSTPSGWVSITQYVLKDADPLS